MLDALGFVEECLVFGQEVGGGVHRAGAQATGVVLPEVLSANLAAVR
ncbi:hypothetical protein [Streptomyces sp. CB02400]|nr:hypothetical protein [Streptomyces sp. CB02400]